MKRDKTFVGTLAIAAASILWTSGVLAQSKLPASGPAASQLTLQSRDCDRITDESERNRCKSDMRKGSDDLVEQPAQRDPHDPRPLFKRMHN